MKQEVINMAAKRSAPNSGKMPAATQGDPSKALEIAKLELRYPDQLETLYSNHTQLMMSNWDLTFDFGLVDLRPGRGSGTKKVDVHSRIIMSPGHAKQFSQVLATTIKTYEEKFGTLNVEPKKD